MTAHARHSRSAPQFEPPLERWPDAGVYQLRLRVLWPIRVTVGRLGRFRLPAGRYVYTGRASRGLRARVWRHACGGTRRHWHIDYLLARRDVRMERIVFVTDDPSRECDVNRRVSASGDCPIPRFGASDCRNGCPAHLCRLR
jgi:Uri superfamily endonuclease